MEVTRTASGPGAPVDLTPSALAPDATDVLTRLVEDLPVPEPNLQSDDEFLAHEYKAERALRRFLRTIQRRAPGGRDRRGLQAVAHILTDLSKIGWTILVAPTSGEIGTRILGRRPGVSLERVSRRRQLLAARGDVLREQTVRSFVQGMERDRRWNKRTVSIFSLMRDGRELSEKLSQDDPELLQSAVDPFIQVVETDATCSETGMLVSDIWRYFRLTWTNAPRSIPARQMRFIIRDRAAPYHPVLGLGELSGASIKVGSRDRFIGWDADAMREWWHEEDPQAFRSWLLDTVEQARGEVYMLDFIQEGLLTGDWSRDACGASRDVLREMEREARDAHEAEENRKGQINPLAMTDEGWRDAAGRPLFRSKRAGRLADLIDVWIDLAPIRDDDSTNSLASFMESRSGFKAASRVLRIAKSTHQGTAIADLTICGAIAPYNEILGGKLVAMLAASPELVEAYRRRYSGRPSIIASSMAGRPVVRRADLVLVATTGLYGIRPSQYDRLSAPAEDLGGAPGSRLRYVYLERTGTDESESGGKTAGWGTFHFGKNTARSLENWLMHETGKRRVSYEYGEGASPRLRMLREGLSTLGLDPTELLVHGLQKTMYVCSLIEQPHKYLLGLESKARYVLPEEPDAGRVSERICDWWWARWVVGRARRSDVLQRMGRHTLVRPVSHGARVALPSDVEEQIPLFEAW